MKTKIGLYFGSFNPIHIGHLIIANHLLQFTELSQIWFIVSPHNPLKEKNTLLADHHRQALVKIAIDDNPNFRVSDIEFTMPKPSYTINTLAYLTDKYPNKEFSLIMGADNLATFDKWKNYDVILQHYQIYVYPRINEKPTKFIELENVHITKAPIIDISSSYIRQCIKEKKEVKYLLPENVYKYINEMMFYQK